VGGSTQESSQRSHAEYVPKQRPRVTYRLCLRR
jgi:hypothetical protein